MNVESNIIKGRYFADKILAELSEKIALLKAQHNTSPTLAIILVGDDPASIIYVRNKIRAAEKIGINAGKIEFPSSITSSQLLAAINKLNNDPTISGIIVQLPLPLHINKHEILMAIDPKKDVDGFHPINVGYLHSNIKEGFVPCTALGCLELIKQYEPKLTGKNVVIIGRSNIVGKPLSALLLREDCSVTICHSKTQNLSKITANADIVIAAIGSPSLLTAEYFNPNSIVIDVGISRQQEGGGVIGDVDFQNVHDKVKYITPVPGGVGPMTIAFLLANTFKAFWFGYSK